MSKILFVTPMWHEEATPHDPKVCNYFVDEWIKQGHEVIVTHFRSSFPRIFMLIGKICPALKERICGDNSDMYLDIQENNYLYKDSQVFSIPIYKYVPHGKFRRCTLDKMARYLQEKLSDAKFVPDIIIGHFCNPSLEIITRLQSSYPKSKQAVILHELGETVERILSKQAESALNSLTAVGYRSLAIQRSVESKFKLSSKRFICYSGIAPIFFQRELPVRNWKNEQISSFLFVGRLAKYKYPRVIIEALNTIYKNGDFSMQYIGSKDLAYQETCDYVVKNGLESSVVFHGQINRESIIDWYDKSDCFVMISDHEAFGLVYLEAMARGCITIAGSNGGMEGIIEHGVNGFLCIPGNVKNLSSIIDEINHMSATEKSQMSANARVTAERFSDSKVAELYLQNIIGS